MRGETTFSNKVHIVNSTSSGLSRKTACVFLYLCLYMLVLPFYIYLGFLAFCFCFFTGGGSTSISSPSEVIFSISLLLMLRTSTLPVISSGNPVVFKTSSSSFSKSLSCPLVGGPYYNNMS